MLTQLLKPKPKPIIGIDIGSHEIKGALIERRANSYKLVKYASSKLPSGAVLNSEIIDHDAVARSLKTLARSFPSAIKLAAVAVAGSAAISKTIYLDASLTDDELVMRIESEAENLFSFPLAEMAYDFEVKGVSPNNPQDNEILLTACKQSYVHNLTDCVHDAGLNVKIVDVAGYALGNLAKILTSSFSENGTAHKLAIVNIGAHVATLSVSDQDETYFVKEFDANAQDMINELHKETKINKVELAEKIQIGELQHPILEQFITDLAQNIKRALQIYQGQSGRNEVCKVILSGGGSAIHDLAEKVEAQLGRACEPLLLSQSTLKLPSKFPADIDAAKFAGAIGLALREYTPWQV